jgi:RES domain
MGRPARFSPLRYPDGLCVPTAYAATTCEAASHETVFHDIDYGSPVKFVAEDTITSCAYSVIFPTRDLQLASLFQPDLSRWNITRTDLIDTAASQYTSTVRWAVAIHKARPDLQGMTWTSRRCDPECAYILFGDRLAPGDFDVTSRQDIDPISSPALFAQIRRFAARANIMIIPSGP